MTDREKLIELLWTHPCDGIDCSTCERLVEVDCDTAAMADKLIANGVTFATDTNVGGKWISVEDRLPETEGNYLVAIKHKYDRDIEYRYDTDAAVYKPHGFGCTDWFWDTFSNWNKRQKYLCITHWMPMPEAPKEEN